jgi:tetratricopeptide (TPR) repeat protein
METLAEAGIIGLVLVGGLLLFVLGVAVRRSLREADSIRIWISAAAAGVAAFATAAAIDWVWQMAAIVAALMALIAVIVAGRDDATTAPAAAAPSRGDGPARWAPRVGLALVALVALGAISVPLAGAIAIRESQTAAQQGNLAAAYRDSLTAQRLQPYAGTPRLQQALVLEAAGELGAAARAARAATRNQPTDWQTWLTLARIDAERGANGQGLQALRRARQLNPRGSVFQST